MIGRPRRSTLFPYPTLSRSYAGRVVERADATTLFARPTHPYTEVLLRSVPRPDRLQRGPLPTIPGFPPSLVDLRSEEHTSELQSQSNLVCRLLLEKKNKPMIDPDPTRGHTGCLERICASPSSPLLVRLVARCFRLALRDLVPAPHLALSSAAHRVA